MQLDLSVIHPALHEQAQRRFDAGDGSGFIFSADNGSGLCLFFDNLWALKERGIYEEALFTAYTSGKIGNYHCPISTFDCLFRAADRDKLRAAGDPLPDGDSFTIYRGVAGSRYYRKVRSYSWSLDRKVAEFFAYRFADLFNLADPAVYRAVVRRDEVLAYAGERESEVIVKPRSVVRMPALAIQEAAA